MTKNGRGGSMTPARVVKTFAHLAELGFDRGIVTLRNVYDPEAFGLLGAEVVPAVENLQAAGR
ncbi:MAG TPA: hypothetical protein VGN32_21130 [Ktedonobacterales bacterium]|nr:hypothetical protein [Ktedonobacterales bacterium]